MARRNVAIESAPELAAAALRWRSDGSENVTVVLQATFRLIPLGLAELVQADPIDPADIVPVKAAADVLLSGRLRPARGERALVGVSVARGVEILWGKRLVASAIDGEPACTLLAEGGPFIGTADLDGHPPDQIIRGADDVTRFNRAPADQRMPFLRGGEHLLVTGWGADDLMVRLPAVTAHAALETRRGPPLPRSVAGGSAQSLVLVGDTLHIDVDRRVATVTWRGHTEVPPYDAVVRASLLPLVAVEEVLGMPPIWERSLCRPSDRPPIFGGLALPATSFPAGRRLVVVVKGTFDMAKGEPAVLSAAQPPLSGDVHRDGDRAASLAYPSDLAPHKPEVDVLASGFVYSRAGAAVATSQLSLGPIDKPIVDKRIVAIGKRQWRRDGTLSPPEPFERIALCHELAFGGPTIADNLVGTGADGSEPPSLERPDDLLKSPSGRPRPACFAPLAPEWTARAGGGSYDRRWLEERWPDVPADFDPRAFNAAPADQRCRALRGDERYRLTAVRPGGEHLEGALPGVRPWGFAARRSNGDVERVPLSLDTLILDGEARTVTQVWRGAIDAGGAARLWLSLGSVDDEPSLAWGWGKLTGAMDERFEPSEGASSHAPTLAGVREVLDEVARTQAAWAAGPPEPPPAAPQATRVEVLGWLERGESLAGRDMTAADLHGLDLSGRDLVGCVLARALLDGACLDGALCRDASFVGASAAATSWIGADLTRVDAAGANLARANLTRASLDQATFAGADLTRATLEDASAEQADFSGADLRGARLARAALGRADLSSTRLDHASFTGARLDDAKLYDAEGAEVTLDGASLANARLEGARLVRLSAAKASAAGSMWERADLSDARLLGANLSQASLNHALLDGAVLSEADATGARLRQASLAKASLLRTNLMNADLEGADLRGADLRGANLYGADMRDVRLEGARTELALLGGTALAPR